MISPPRAGPASRFVFPSMSARTAIPARRRRTPPMPAPRTGARGTNPAANRVATDTTTTTASAGAPSQTDTPGMSPPVAATAPDPGVHSRNDTPRTAAAAVADEARRTRSWSRTARLATVSPLALCLVTGVCSALVRRRCWSPGVCDTCNTRGYADGQNLDLSDAARDRTDKFASAAGRVDWGRSCRSERARRSSSGRQASGASSPSVRKPGTQAFQPRSRAAAVDEQAPGLLDEHVPWLVIGRGRGGRSACEVLIERATASLTPAADEREYTTVVAEIDACWPGR